MKQILSKIVQTLLPVLAKRDIKATISSSLKELDDYTIPAVNSVFEAFPKGEYKSKFAKNFEKFFQSKIQSRFKGGSVEIILQSLKRISENTHALQRVIDKEFPNEVVIKTLGYDQAYILQYCQAVLFLSRFSRVLASGIVANELGERNRKFELSKAQVKYLEENMNAYIGLIGTMAVTSKNLDVALNKVPDMLIDVEDTGAADMLGEGVTDPLKMGIYIQDFNIIFHARIAIEDYLNHRYEEAKAKRIEVSYMLLELQNMQEGKFDPSIAKEIEVTQERLDVLNAKIRKYEER